MQYILVLSTKYLYGVSCMADDQKMYAILCGAVDNALTELERAPSCAHITARLTDALSRAEALYPDAEDTKLVLLKSDKQKK